MAWCTSRPTRARSASSRKPGARRAAPAASAAGVGGRVRRIRAGPPAGLVHRGHQQHPAHGV
ncbi:hypothetical protein E2544_17965 [Achromobacter insolitus]|nr:hypothetical protein E2544_17965 [Achromobacter insolitus]